MSACQVCGYHSGQRTSSQLACPLVHLYRPAEVLPPHRDDCRCFECMKETK